VNLAVVLVEPAGPLNVGSVARLCANFSVDELRLVAPRCDHLGDEARLMAVHGEALLEQAQLFPTLEAALADCRRVVATSGRIEEEALPLNGPAEALSWPQAADTKAASAPAALVFGREDRGLSNAELLQAGRILRLETSEAYASMNLSHAVAVCLHELRRCPTPSEPQPEPCQRELLEAALTDAEELLLEVGFLYPHTAQARMAKLRALLQRAEIRDEEVALLRGMVRQLRWASRRDCP